MYKVAGESPKKRPREERRVGKFSPIKFRLELSRRNLASENLHRENTRRMLTRYYGRMHNRFGRPYVDICVN